MTIEFNCTLLFNLNPHIYLHYPSHPLICHHFTVTKLNYFLSIYFILLLHRQNWSTNPLVFVICFLLLEQFLNHKKNLIFFVNYFINIYIYWFIFFRIKVFIYNLQWDSTLKSSFRKDRDREIDFSIERRQNCEDDSIQKIFYLLFCISVNDIKLYYKKNIQDIFIVFVQ